MTTILQYLEDLDRKGYTVMPAEITIQDVLNMVGQTPEQVEAWKALKIVVGYIKPEPETMTRWEFPWVDDLEDLHETQENALDRGLQ